MKLVLDWRSHSWTLFLSSFTHKAHDFFTHRKRKKLFEKSFVKKIYLARNYSDLPWKWTLVDTIDDFWVQLMFVNNFSGCIFIIKQKKSFNFLRTAKNDYFSLAQLDSNIPWLDSNLAVLLRLMGTWNRHYWRISPSNYFVFYTRQVFWWNAQWKRLNKSTNLWSW